MSAKFKKGDAVLVISGKDKGKRGVINSVITGGINGIKAVVSDINIAKRHTKPNKNFPNGGIFNKEMPIHVSNLSHIDPKLDVLCRVGYKILEDGKKVRYSKRSGELIDKI